MTYFTVDGDAVNAEQIEQAVAEHRAVIIWGHGEWRNIGSLMICATPEDAALEAERDTRDECYSMREEIWCHRAASVAQAKRAAAGLLIQR